MFGSQRTRKGARGARAFLFARLERLRFAFRARQCGIAMRVDCWPMASPLSPSTRRRASSVETHAN